MKRRDEFIPISLAFNSKESAERFQDTEVVDFCNKRVFARQDTNIAHMNLQELRLHAQNLHVIKSTKTQDC